MIHRPPVRNNEHGVTQLIQKPHHELVREARKAYEDSKKKAIQETQSSDGSFAPVINSVHYNFIVPCLPSYLA